MKTILHHSIFDPLPNGHGGERRTYQIVWEVQTQGVDRIDLQYHQPQPLSLRRIGLSLLLLLRVYGIRIWKSPKAFLRKVRDVAWYYDTMVAYFRDTDCSTFLWESVRPEWYFLPFLAHRYGKSVIACPHNIETLVPKQEYASFHVNVPSFFAKEIAILQGCQQVYAISHEETWLYNIYGVPAQYYPYKPVGKILQGIEQLKNQRKLTQYPSTSYMLLGTAINAPTRMGMQQIIDYWAEQKIPCTLRVAGYGTENLTIPPSKNIQFVGTLSAEQLSEEQCQTRALIIYQPPTTGALTRIEEALTAHIPVIANYAAARSYQQRENIFIYHDMEELHTIIAEKNNPIMQ